jgi:heme oxygenase (biliverdin-IX-beta and delta-forming)
MDLRHQIQIETQLLHNKIEQSFFFKKIIFQQITINEYRQLLKKFYGFIEPCEKSIHALSCKSILTHREKTILLKQDLQALGLLENEYSSISQCPVLPKLSKYEHVLGYLYVIEGSTLGGQIIIRMLQ